jgi:HD-GYP domain-containing protein (c-di-GMP phosphodiesterase class II)
LLVVQPRLSTDKSWAGGDATAGRRKRSLGGDVVFNQQNKSGFGLERSTELLLSEVIAALSYALDLTGGQPAGHASRSCVLGMRIGQELRLPVEQSSALFYSLLLKDLGCSTNASKMCYLFGSDDRAAKATITQVDWSSLKQTIKAIARLAVPHAPIRSRIAKCIRVALAAPKVSKELIEMRCERGARIAHDLQLPDATADAIHALDEHWDGSGHPDGLRGEQIPLLARVVSLAQTFEVFASNAGLEAAFNIARQRKGAWFDPRLVKALMSFRRDERFWELFFAEDPTKLVATFEPRERKMTVDDATLDRIAHGFALVIDAKSPWTFKHSEGVAAIAAGIATTMNMSAEEVRDIRRAGLLHDVGKLGVSNMILDKPCKLTPEEIGEMRKHTAYTYKILQQVAGFRHLAPLAAAHHERLDGKGYHLGLDADQLSQGARILAVADMYEALTARRPYRQDLSQGQVMEILAKNAGPGICPVTFAALKRSLDNGGYVPQAVAA